MSWGIDDSHLGQKQISYGCRPWNSQGMVVSRGVRGGSSCALPCAVAGLESWETDAAGVAC